MGVTRETKIKVSLEDKTTAELKKIRKELSDFGDHAVDSFKNVATYAAVAGTAAVAAFAALVSQSLQTGDDLAKTADKLGLTTEALAGLHLAAELSNVGISTMDMALQRMTRRLSEAAAGGGEAKDAIKELGLDAVKLNAMNPDQAFQEIAEAMGKVDNQSDKVRLAFKLFDSEGVALVNTLKLGKEGLKAAAAEADALGIALSRVDAAKMEAAGDAMAKVGLAAQGVGNIITVEVAPIIEALSDEIVEYVKANRDVIKEQVQATVLGAARLADGLKPIISGMKDEAVSIWDTFNDLPDWVKSLGVIGAILGGKQGVFVLGGALHLLEAADNIIRGLAEVSVGNISLTDFATANQTELKELLADLDKLPATAEEANIEVKKSFEEMLKGIMAGWEEYEVVGKKSSTGVLETVGSNATKIEALEKKLTDDLKKLTLSEVDYAIAQAERERDEALKIANGRADLITDINERYRLAEEKAIDDAVEKDLKAQEKTTKNLEKEKEKQEDELRDFLDTYGSMMADVLGISEETWTAAALTLETAFSEIDLNEVFGGIFKDLDFKDVFAKSGAGATLGTAIAESIEGNRELQNAGGILGGAAMGFQAGSVVGAGIPGAAIGAVIGLASGNFGPGEDSGAFGEHGAGKRSDIEGDPAGSLAKGIDLVGQAIERLNPDVLEKVLRQIQEITREDYSLNLDELIPDEALAGRFDDLMASLEPLADTVADLGIANEITKAEMQGVSEEAAQFALDAALAGDASELWAQTSLSLAVALNTKGAAVLKDITAMTTMIDTLALVDDRTRGLAQSSEALALADTLIANSLMLTTDQFGFAIEAQKELTAIEAERTAITEEMLEADKLSTAQIEAYQARLAELNDTAIIIEEGLTNMTDQSDAAAIATGKMGDEAGDAKGELDELSGSVSVVGDQSDIAAGKVYTLYDSIEKLHDKSITVTVYEQTVSLGHEGIFLQPFEKEMVVRKDEMLVPPEKRVEFAERVLSREAPRGVGGDGVSIGSAPSVTKVYEINNNFNGSFIADETTMMELSEIIMNNIHRLERLGA